MIVWATREPIPPITKEVHDEIHELTKKAVMSGKLPMKVTSLSYFISNGKRKCRETLYNKDGSLTVTVVDA